MKINAATRLAAAKPSLDPKTSAAYIKSLNKTKKSLQKSAKILEDTISAVDKVLAALHAGKDLSTAYYDKLGFSDMAETVEELDNEASDIEGSLFECRFNNR